MIPADQLSQILIVQHSTLGGNTKEKARLKRMLHTEFNSVVVHLKDPELLPEIY